MSYAATIDTLPALTRPAKGSDLVRMGQVDASTVEAVGTVQQLAAGLAPYMSGAAAQSGGSGNPVSGVLTVGDGATYWTVPANGTVTTVQTAAQATGGTVADGTRLAVYLPLGGTVLGATIATKGWVALACFGNVWLPEGIG